MFQYPEPIDNIKIPRINTEKVPKPAADFKITTMPDKPIQLKKTDATSISLQLESLKQEISIIENHTNDDDTISESDILSVDDDDEDYVFIEEQ